MADQLTFGQTVVKESYTKTLDEESPQKIVDFREYQEIKKMNQDYQRLFGKQSHPRKLDPSMFDILTGGYEGQVSGDYLKPTEHLDAAEQPAEDKNAATLANENNVKFRIKKSKSKFITEQKDNYRTFVLSPNGEELLVDYRDAVDNGPTKRRAERENHWTTTNLE